MLRGAILSTQTLQENPSSKLKTSRTVGPMKREKYLSLVRGTPGCQALNSLSHKLVGHDCTLPGALFCSIAAGSPLLACSSLAMVSAPGLQSWDQSCHSQEG